MLQDTYGNAIMDLVRCDQAHTTINEAAVGTAALQRLCHDLSHRSGWWQEYIDMPQQYRKHFLLGRIALMHSELSEGVEGLRKNVPDDHLPHRPMLEVEMADAIIRILDMAGALQLDVAGAIIEKLAYNQQRPDHKKEAREAEGGKSM
jgi:NTP pyrophosphatase (non-canonical NTP hydrolase)